MCQPLFSHFTPPSLPGGGDSEDFRPAGVTRCTDVGNIGGVDFSSHCYGNSHATWDHKSVTCHPAEVTFPPLPQPKLVLRRMSKAELA